MSSIHRFILRLLLPLFKIFAYPLFLFLGPIKASNQKRVPKRGALLILANHRSNIDPILLQAFCRRKLYYMAKRELFAIPVVGTLIRWLGAFPISQTETDPRALRTALRLLKQGEAVAIFPEGELTKTGSLQAILPGAIWLAKRAEVPILCCRLGRTELIIPYGSFLPRPAFRTIDLCWGEPKYFDKNVPKSEITSWIRDQLHELISI